MPKTAKKTSSRSSRKQKLPTENMKVKLPGILQFSKTVLGTLVAHRSVFLRLLALASIVSLMLSAQATYTYYTDLVQVTKELAKQMPELTGSPVTKAVTLTVAVVNGASNSTLAGAQQLFLGMLHLLMWLIVVWLLRHLLSGNVVKLRDGLYSAAAPLISTCLVVLAGLVQLLPLALIVSLMVGIGSTGVASGFVWGLVALVVLVLFSALTIYWLAGTVFAAVIVTLPNTYPWAALRSARQVISGYRREVVLRLVWLGFLVCIAMFAVVMATVLLDVLTGYKISGLVVLVSQVMGVALFIYSSAYVYLLYRGVIDERS